MEPNGFDLAYRRKLLYKRKKRRQLILRLSSIFIIFFSISVAIMLNMKSNNKFVATINKPNDITTDGVFTVCIDPGHGDWDIGAQGKNGSNEKDIALNIALKLGDLLTKEDNIKVIYTRTSDSLPWLATANDSLKERLKISKISEADLFISIHCNSNYDNPESRGVETWFKHSSIEGEVLSTYLQQELVKLSYTENRGLKSYTDSEEAFAVLEKNTATAALIELGFLSNGQDEYFLSSEAGKTSCAKAIYNGIINYKNSINPDDTTTEKDKK